MILCLYSSESRRRYNRSDVDSEQHRAGGDGFRLQNDKGEVMLRAGEPERPRVEEDGGFTLEG